MSNRSHSSPIDEDLKIDCSGKPKKKEENDIWDEDCLSSDGEENKKVEQAKHASQLKFLNPWTRVKVHKEISIVAYIHLIWPKSALQNVPVPCKVQEVSIFRKARNWEVQHFSENDVQLLDIVDIIEPRRNWFSDRESWAKEIKRYRSQVSNQPYSLLGELMKEGCWKKIKFVLNYFKFDKASLNSLQIEESGCHLTELLIRHRKLKLLFVLVKKWNLKLSGRHYWDSGYNFFSALLVAVELGDNASTLRELWRRFSMIKGFKDLLTTPDEESRTPLSIAVMNDSPQMVKALLEFKAPVNQIGWGGDTALAIGMQLGTSKTILSMLLDAKADVNKRDSTGVAPKTRVIFNSLIKSNAESALAE